MVIWSIPSAFPNFKCFLSFSQRSFRLCWVKIIRGVRSFTHYTHYIARSCCKAKTAAIPVIIAFCTESKLLLRPSATCEITFFFLGVQTLFLQIFTFTGYTLAQHNRLCVESYNLLNFGWAFNFKDSVAHTEDCKDNLWEGSKHKLRTDLSSTPWMTPVSLKAL